MIKNFNDGWIFSKQGESGREITLPHDAMLEEKRYPTCRNAKQSGYFPGGKYTYIKHFEISENDILKDIVIEFEGVYRNAKVYINNTLAKENKYGFILFDVDISKLVKVGDNIVRVEVDNSLVPNCRWYSGSGIYRPVWLKITNKCAPKTLKISTININPTQIEIVADESASISIYNEENKLIKEGKPGIYTIEDATLWSADHPYLYRCISKIQDEEIETKFGIRIIECTGKEGLKINGESVLLKGGCLHSENGILGACEFKDADERKVRILKENGFNAIRCAHNPANKSLLDACDKIGMYVMDESFDGWYTPKEYHDFSRDFESEYKSIVKTMVERDFNHPSVIIYSMGNEVTETAEEKGIKLLNEMKEICHSLDKTRPVTCGVNILLDVYTKMGIGVYKEKGEYKKETLVENKKLKEKKSGSSFFNYWTQKLGKILFIMSKGKTATKVIDAFAPSVDIIGLNYASSRYDQDSKKHPDRVMVGTETLVGDLPYNWDRCKKYPQLIGDFVWSAFDYLGETMMGYVYPSYKGLPLLSSQGMIDITGLPLASMYFMQTVWGERNKPYIAVSPLNHAKDTPQKGSWQFTDSLSSWNWQGYENTKANVQVYSDAYMITLYLNDKKISICKTKNFIAKFKVKYKPGTLTAVALDESGKEISRNSISSGNGNVRLNVNVDKTKLTSDGQSLSYVEIEFTDEENKLLPYIEQRVDVKIDGESISLAGFGSALYKTDEVFNQTHHNTYRGRALAILRSKNIKGESKITISSNNVEPVSFIINVD